MTAFINTIDVIGDDAVIDSIITKSIEEYRDNRVTTLGMNVFSNCTQLTVVDVPAVVTTRDGAVSGCTKLSEVNFPALTSLGWRMFNGCSSLTNLKLPKVSSVNDRVFTDCSALRVADFSALTSLNSSAFNNCYNLIALVLRSETVATLGNTNVFTNCYHILGTTHTTHNPNGDKDGYVYVPSTLVDSYKTATNWSTYTTQFRALEDYTIDGTITGELDESKI